MTRLACVERSPIIAAKALRTARATKIGEHMTMKRRMDVYIDDVFSYINGVECISNPKFIWIGLCVCLTASTKDMVLGVIDTPAFKSVDMFALIVMPVRQMSDEEIYNSYHCTRDHFYNSYFPQLFLNKTLKVNKRMYVHEIYRYNDVCPILLYIFKTQ